MINPDDSVSNPTPDQIWAAGIQNIAETAVQYDRSDEAFYLDVASALVTHRSAIERVVVAEPTQVQARVAESQSYQRLSTAVDALVTAISARLPVGSPIQVRVTNPDTGPPFITALKRGDAAAHAEFTQLLAADPVVAELDQRRRIINATFAETTRNFARNKQAVIAGLQTVPTAMTALFTTAEVEGILRQVRSLSESGAQVTADAAERIVTATRAKKMQPAQELLRNLSETVTESEALRARITAIQSQLPGNNGKEYAVSDAEKENIKAIAQRAGLLRSNILTAPDIQGKQTALGFLVDVDTIPKVEAARAALPDAKLVQTVHEEVEHFFNILRTQNYRHSEEDARARLNQFFGVDPKNDARLLLLGEKRLLLTQTVIERLTQSRDLPEKTRLMRAIEADVHNIIEESNHQLQEFKTLCDTVKTCASYAEYSQDRAQYQQAVEQFGKEERARVAERDSEYKLYRIAPFQQRINGYLGALIQLVEQLDQATVYTVQQPELQSTVVRISRHAQDVQDAVRAANEQLQEYCSHVDHDLLLGILADGELNSRLLDLESQGDAVDVQQRQLPVRMLFDEYTKTVATPMLVEQVRQTYAVYSQQAQTEFSRQRFSDDDAVNQAVHVIAETLRTSLGLVADPVEMLRALREKMDGLEVQLLQREKEILESELLSFSKEFNRLSESNVEAIVPIAWRYSTHAIVEGFRTWQTRKNDLLAKRKQLMEKCSQFNQAARTASNDAVTIHIDDSFAESTQDWANRLVSVESVFEEFIQQREAMAQNMLNFSAVEDFLTVAKSEKYDQFFRMQFQYNEEKYAANPFRVYPEIVKSAMRSLGAQWRKSSIVGNVFEKERMMPDYLRVALPLVADKETQRPGHELCEAQRIVEKLRSQPFGSFEDIQRLLDEAVRNGMGAYTINTEVEQVTIGTMSDDFRLIAARPIRIDATNAPLAQHRTRVHQRLVGACRGVPELADTAYSLFLQKADQQKAAQLLDSRQYDHNLQAFQADLEVLGEHAKLYTVSDAFYVSAGQFARTLRSLLRNPDSFINKGFLIRSVQSVDQITQRLQQSLEGLSNPVITVAAKLLQQYFVYDYKK